MTLEITPEIEEMVQTIFRAGQYESESQVLYEALGLLKKRDRLRSDINQGLAELERGDCLEGDEVLAELEAKAVAFTKANQ